MRDKHDAFVDYLTQRWLSCESCVPPLIGCTDAEIHEVMRQQAVTRLPALYRKFLETMGRRDGEVGKFLNATLTYPEVGYYKQDEFCDALLRSFGIDDSIFVFLTDGANVLSYFDTLAHDDPPVYTIRESSHEGIYYEVTEWGQLSYVLVDLVEQQCSIGME